jgi:2-amino-4-hydroxy-6-hydroxymethyldihydropteridine diphosphokinase
VALIIATGSNIGDRYAHLATARKILAEQWMLIASSQVYTSAAVDNEAQPEFMNQVLQFALPWEDPQVVMEKILQTERELGRVRDTWRGPRVIDIDIVFWGLSQLSTPLLTVPHPRWQERSFVAKPLQELPFFHAIEKCFTIPTTFAVEASPLR